MSFSGIKMSVLELFEYLYPFIESVEEDDGIFIITAFSGKAPPYRKVVIRNSSFKNGLLDLLATMGL